MSEGPTASYVVRSQYREIGEHAPVAKCLKIRPSQSQSEQFQRELKDFKYMSPTYTSELYKTFNHGHKTRKSSCRLQLPYRNTSYGHKALSFSGPKLWNNLPAYIKSSSNTNAFKHDIRKLFFKGFQKKEDSVYFYY